jgi:hypothetical protein
VDASSSSWFVVLLAFVAANLPFMNERLLAVVPGVFTLKPFWIRLVELLLWYVLVGAVAQVLEAHAGNVFPQRWEFYAVTGCLFIVFAFPGFVFRYLRKQHR